MPRLALARLAALYLALGTACNAHPIGGYDDGPQIDKHGISVPVPPPSLWDNVKIGVEVEGELGYSDPEPQTSVFLIDTVGGYNGFVYAETDGSFHFAYPNLVDLDLTDNCIEVWSEAPGPYGEMSLHSFFHVFIDPDDDQALITEQFFSGC